MTGSIFLLSAVALASEDEPEYKSPPSIALVAPLGVPQLSQRRWGLGAMFSLLQVSGFTFGGVATNRMYAAGELEDYEGERTWKMLSFAGIATGTATWFISVLDASRYHQVHSQAYYQRAVEWDRARAGM
ncbi:MAG TPA: hypothetical protein QGF58_14670 [Myxococcota bacterium]|nr:hypothetical protein [Myxococcota bacterium]